MLAVWCRFARGPDHEDGKARLSSSRKAQLKRLKTKTLV
jgi:hypothetical protein